MTTPPAPEILHEGRYRLYRKYDGTLRIQYKRDDKDEEDFVEIPAAAIAIVDAGMSGKLSPVQLMGEIVKLMGQPT